MIFIVACNNIRHIVSSIKSLAAVSIKSVKCSVVIVWSNELADSVLYVWPQVSDWNLMILCNCGCSRTKLVVPTLPGHEFWTKRCNSYMTDIFCGGVQSWIPVTKLGMRSDYETPFVKFLLGTLEQHLLLSSPVRLLSRRRTLVTATLIHNFYNLLTFCGLCLRWKVALVALTTNLWLMFNWIPFALIKWRLNVSKVRYIIMCFFPFIVLMGRTILRLVW